MNKVKMILKPDVHGIFKENTDMIDDFDKLFAANDLHGLSLIYPASAKKITEMIPGVTNEKLAKAIADIADGCYELARKLENGGTLEVVANFEKMSVHKVLSAMK